MTVIVITSIKLEWEQYDISIKFELKLFVQWDSQLAANSVHYVDGLVQDCSNSIANALALLQSCTKPLMCRFHKASLQLCHNTQP